MLVHNRSVKTMSDQPFPVRRAAVTVVATLLIVAAVLLTVLVVDAWYVITVNRGLQNVSSVMALAGAPDLLDWNVLKDAPGAPPPDQATARATARASALAYGQSNNNALLALDFSDSGEVKITPGYVADVTTDPPVLQLTSTMPDNTLFVCLDRTTTGAHPVTYPVDLAGTTRTTEIRGGAYATLDNNVVGFLPETEMAAPLVPLGILAGSWSGDRTMDQNGDKINEMLVYLSTNPPQASAPANGVLLFYSGSNSLDSLQQQIDQGGLFPTDLQLSGGSIGPATSQSLLPIAGTQSGDASTQAVMNEFATIAQSNQNERVFPLVQQVTGVGSDGSCTAQVEGFVACTILDVEVDAYNRPAVRVQPCYLIHRTAWTVPPGAAPAGLQPNLYIYKLRLSR